MTTFDAASPLVGLLIGEPGAQSTADTLAASERSTICAINLAEVIDRVTRADGAPAPLVRERISLWTSLGLRLVDLTHGLADWRHRSPPPTNRWRVWRERSVSRVIALPDSRGRTPD